MLAPEKRLRAELASTRVSGSSDIIFVLGFVSWSGAAARGFTFPEDRFASSLLSHARARRVLVCDPPRSALRRLARAMLRAHDSQFPTGSLVAHHAPLRLRSEDPGHPEAMSRAYAAYERGIRRVALQRGLEHPAVVTANPLLAGFGDFSWAGPVTYYAWDDWAASPPLRRWWPSYSDAFARVREKQRRVVAVSTAIIDRIAPTAAHAVVPNGVDACEWKRLPPPPAWFARRPSPRLLYVGSLESRIDTQQLRGLATAFPSGSVTLVGPLLDEAHFASLRDIPNVMIHPRVSRSDIPGLLAHADVGLIPHVRSRLTEAMSPLKLYEYLAAGRPVAAVDLPGIAGVSDRVVTVPPSKDMVPAVRRALALGGQSESDRLSFVEQNSWEQRFEALLDIALAS